MQEEEAPAVAADPAISNSHVMKMLSAMLRSSYDVRPCSCLPLRIDRHTGHATGTSCLEYGRLDTHWSKNSPVNLMSDLLLQPGPSYEAGAWQNGALNIQLTNQDTNTPAQVSMPPHRLKQAQHTSVTPGNTPSQARHDSAPQHTQCCRLRVLQHGRHQPQSAAHPQCP